MAKFKMAEHQVFGEFVMSCNNALGCFYDMGTGKTQMALSRAYHALEDGEIENLLVVCPASLTGNWELSFDKMLDFEGYTKEGVERLKSIAHVTSYQKLYRTETDETHHRNGYVSKKKTLVLRDDVDKYWDMIILDEAHALGGHSSNQTKVCLALARMSTYRYALTGTPVSGRGGGADYQKLYGIISFLDPDKWKNWTEFCDLYVRSYDRFFKPRLYNEDACKALLKEYGITARLRDCYDLPGETWTVIDCPLVEKKIYKDILNGYLDGLGIEIEFAGTEFVKMRQVCSGHLRKDDHTPTILKTSKDAALKDILEGVDGKIVIFCDYTPSVIRCVEICEKAGFKTIRYDGTAKNDDWKEFQFGDADAIVAQYQKGGPGLDLFAAHTMVFYEATQRVLSLDQAKRRIMRKGQENHCNYYALITPGSIESKTWQSVTTGVDVTNEMMDNWARGGEL